MKAAISKFMRYAFIITVILALAVPTPVLAQDVEPTQEPEATEVVSEVATEVPTEEATEAATEVATEVLPAEETAEPTEVPAEAETATPTEIAAEAPEDVVVEEITDIVVAAAEAEVVLTDENGNAVVMASNETVDLLSSNPDPWIIRGGITYRFLADCTPFPDDATNICTQTLIPVQKAIDFALAGETVFLGPGTFVEEVDITKDLILQGSAGTTIKSPTSLDTDFTVSSTPRKPIISVTNGATVTIDSITVDGDHQGTANNSFMGIGYYNAGGTISNNTIINIMDTTFSGVQHGVGIYAYNDDGISRILNVLNNQVFDFQKTGIALMGTGLTVNVDGNQVFGEGDTSVTAQNGIQLSNGVAGSVTNNVIKDVEYTGSGWTSSGVIVQDTTGIVNVDNNQITNAQTGVYAINGQVSASGNTVEESSYYGILSYNGSLDAANNTFENNNYGLYGYLAPVNASGNTFESNTYGLVIYPPTNSYGTVANNQFINNGYGFYTTDPSITLRENSFTLNSIGAYLTGSTLGNAMYNYWGCDLGGDPANSVPCNSATGYNSSPWLIDPDSDGVYDSSDGTGGYVDNCPLVYNPDQSDADGDGFGNACDAISYKSQMDTDVDGIKDDVDNCVYDPNPNQLDSDEDGVGDVCDETPFGNLQPLLVPVTGGMGFSPFNCNATTTLRLPSSDYVMASPDFCGMDGELTTTLEVVLPKDLPTGVTYVSALNLLVLDSLDPLDYIADPGRLTYSFAIPAELKDSEFTVYFWDVTLNQGLGDWVELPAYAENTDGTPVITSLHPDEATELRMILEGVQVTGEFMNRVEFVTNFPGLFILAIK